MDLSSRNLIHVGLNPYHRKICSKGMSKKLTIRISEKIWLIWLCFLALLVTAQSQPRSESVVLPDGIGPVKIGMTLSQASKALGIQFIRETGYDGDCYYIRPRQGFKGVGFMVTNKRIARIDINTKIYRTELGATLGDSEAKIKRLYKGQIRVGQHAYVDTGHYLTVTPKGSRYQIVFETDGKTVTTYRVGKNPEVGYIEGCS